MDVLVVESPAKAKTIGKYLGRGLHRAGLLRPCPRPAAQGRLGPPGRGFRHGLGGRRPSRRSGSTRSPRRSPRAASSILATDPDREGEAISWHVREVLKRKKALEGVDVKRVTFNEITKQSVLDAIAHPRELDQDADRRLPGAPRARLPRRLHPVARAVAQAAGQPLGRPRAVGGAAPDLRARGRDRGLQDPRILDGRGRCSAPPGRQTLHGPPDPSRRPQARQVRPRHRGAAPSRPSARSSAAPSRSPSIERRQVRRNPPPPFTTSTLQQEASRKLGFGAATAMRIAQRLYEGVDIGGETVGLITYMRTDGVQLAPEAIGQTRRLIETKYGQSYLPRDAARLHVQGQERPGGARGDPPDRPVPHAAGRRRLSATRTSSASTS